MNRTFLVAQIAAGVLCVASAMAQTIPGSEFYVGLWRGFGSPPDENGVVRCIAASSGPQGDEVMFNVASNKRFLLALTLPQGDFQRGEVIDVSIWTNVEDAVAVPATAANERTLLLVFTDSDWVANYLQRSQTLTVTSDLFQHTFSIASANLALEEVQTCLETNATPG